VSFSGPFSDLHPADRQKLPSKRHFQGGVVQKSAKTRQSPGLLQACGKLGAFAPGKIAEFREKSRFRPFAIHRSSEKLSFIISEAAFAEALAE
jgi:hypothetical protein